MKTLNLLIKLFGMAMTLIYVAIGIFILRLKPEAVSESTGTITDTLRYNLFHYHILIACLLITYGAFRIYRLYVAIKDERDQDEEVRN